MNDLCYATNVFNDKLEIVIEEKKPIILYGAGLNSIGFLFETKKQGKQPNIICIADADTNKQGRNMLGIPIIPPEGLKKYDPGTLVIITPATYCLTITENLNNFGFFNLLYFDRNAAHYVKGASRFTEFTKNNCKQLDILLSENQEKISAVRSFLEHDKKSAAVFEARMEFAFYSKLTALEPLWEDNQYFPNDIIHLTDNEVFVDCGALNGGSVLDFIARVNSYNYIYSFEPEPLSFERTKAVLEMNKVSSCRVFKLGVYDTDGEISFSSIADTMRPSGKICGTGDIVIQCASLDTLLYNEPHRPTFIKMDIEGAELNALIGARKIIERDMPKLAICIYHNKPNVHLWEIPYWIKTNFPDYKIYLRQHSSHNETVCYAVRN